MSVSDDFPGDMEEIPFDERDREAVFGASGADVPDSLRDVADLVRAARRPGSADELVGGDDIVAGIAAAIGDHAAPLPSVAEERIPVLHKYRTAKLTAAATVALMLGGTAAAAATTGSLPTSSPRHAVTVASEPTGPSGATGETGSHGKHHGLSGDVASVNGSTDPTACGTGDTGTFTVTGHHGETFTVNVSPTTKYKAKGETDPSFANVCVGKRVKVKGIVDDTTVAADAVRVKSAHKKHHKHHGEHHARRGAFGTIASVNGSTDPTACGTGDTGSFTVTDKLGNTFTVNVGPATTYLQNDVPAPTFANICVGGLAFAKGTVTDTTVDAAKVFILPPKPADDPPMEAQHKGVFGEVASVNGSSDPSACGTGDTGSFTVTDRDGNTFTVNVDPETTFFGKHHHDDDNAAGFADVCVGKQVGAKGDVTDTTVAADKVFVLGSHDNDGDGDDHDGEHHDGWKHGRHHNGDWNHDGDDDGDHEAHQASFRSGGHDGSRGDCDKGHDGANDSGHED